MVGLFLGGCQIPGNEAVLAGVLQSVFLLRSAGRRLQMQLGGMSAYLAVLCMSELDAFTVLRYHK